VRAGTRGGSRRARVDGSRARVRVDGSRVLGDGASVRCARAEGRRELGTVPCPTREGFLARLEVGGGAGWPPGSGGVSR